MNQEEKEYKKIRRKMLLKGKTWHKLDKGESKYWYVDKSIGLITDKPTIWIRIFAPFKGLMYWLGDITEDRSIPKTFRIFAIFAMVLYGIIGLFSVAAFITAFVALYILSIAILPWYIAILFILASIFGIIYINMD